jgi:hypothetical protein
MNRVPELERWIKGLSPAERDQVYTHLYGEMALSEGIHLGPPPGTPLAKGLSLGPVPTRANATCPYCGRPI